MGVGAEDSPGTTEYEGGFNNNNNDMLYGVPLSFIKCLPILLLKYRICKICSREYD